MDTVWTKRHFHESGTKMGLSFLIICYLLSTGVMSESDQRQGIFGKLDGSPIKNVRGSFSDVRGGPMWYPAGFQLEDRDRSTFQEPEVMDKPGLFFPDDINPWTKWSSCLDGVQTRTRGPIDQAILKRCGHLDCIENRPCQLPTLAEPAQWSSWGQWSQCLRENTISTRTRTRQCQDQSEGTGRIVHSLQKQAQDTQKLDCAGSAYEKAECQVQLQKFEWANWDQWSPCERGSQYRTRNCWESNQCLGAKYEAQICQTPSYSAADRTKGQRQLCNGWFPFNLANCGLLSTKIQREQTPTSYQTWRRG